MTSAAFYLACMLTMATVLHHKAVVLFNSPLHVLEVGPILQTRVPVSQVAFGRVSIVILRWFAGALIAGLYNLSVRLGTH